MSSWLDHFIQPEASEREGAERPTEFELIINDSSNQFAHLQRIRKRASAQEDLYRHLLANFVPAVFYEVFVQMMRQVIAKDYASEPRQITQITEENVRQREHISRLEAEVEVLKRELNVAAAVNAIEPLPLPAVAIPPGYVAEDADRVSGLLRQHPELCDELKAGLEAIRAAFGASAEPVLRLSVLGGEPTLCIDWASGLPRDEARARRKEVDRVWAINAFARTDGRIVSRVG